MRIAHLSDLHFASASYNPLQFFSKRWLGNWNLIFFRSRLLKTQHLWTLPEFFKDLKVDHVCITGDLTTTSLSQEFSKAHRFIALLKEEFNVHLIPGNHDCYTKGSERDKRFYKYFPDPSEKFELKKDRVTFSRLNDRWWWIGIDSAVATSLIHSHGTFSKEMEDVLLKVLQEIPDNDSIIVGNHFPLFETGRSRHDLKNSVHLQNVLKDSRIKLYLHGHDHIPYIIHSEQTELPLVLNAGSCAQYPLGSFYIFEVEKNECAITHYQWNENENRWEISKKLHHQLKK